MIGREIGNEGTDFFNDLASYFRPTLPKSLVLKD